MFVLLAAAACAWVALLVLAPLLPASAAAVLYAVGSVICHQRAERSLHLYSMQLPVCGRCVGIYAGAAIGSLAAAASTWRSRMERTSPRALLAYGAVPTVLTIAAEWSGAWSGSNMWRAAAGAPLGLSLIHI